MADIQNISFAKNLLFVVLISISLMNSAIARDSGATASHEKFSIALSDEAQDAINNGVRLFFKCEFAVRQSYWLFSTSRQLKNHQFVLMRHALSNRYIVKRDGLDAPHIFRTIVEATNYVAAQAVILLEFYDDAENSYSMRISLDIFDLPGPMRLNAFISDAWDIDTGWISWSSGN